MGPPRELAVGSRRIELGGQNRRLHARAALCRAQVRDVDLGPRLVPWEVVVEGVKDPERRRGIGVGGPEYRIISSSGCWAWVCRAVGKSESTA